MRGCMQEAVAAFERLPAEQYGTGWVLCCVGRAHYEMVDYPAAARAFEWARQADPTRLEVPHQAAALSGLRLCCVKTSLGNYMHRVRRLSVPDLVCIPASNSCKRARRHDGRLHWQLPAAQGLEVYSTVLWHLKREVALAHLAQEALAWDRRSPHAWAILGNCFSLQKVLPVGPFAPYYSNWCSNLCTASLARSLAAFVPAAAAPDVSGYWKRLSSRMLLLHSLCGAVCWQGGCNVLLCVPLSSCSPMSHACATCLSSRCDGSSMFVFDCASEARYAMFYIMPAVNKWSQALIGCYSAHMCYTFLGCMSYRVSAFPHKYVTSTCFPTLLDREQVPDKAWPPRRSTRRRCATSSARCSWSRALRTRTRWRGTSTAPARTSTAPRPATRPPSAWTGATTTPGAGSYLGNA